MIVRLSGSADAALTDLDRLDRLHAEADGPLDRMRPPGWCRLDGDGAHVWLDIARCRELGRSAAGDEWVDRYDAMIAYATAHGWTNDDATHLRAHLEHPPSDPSGA